MDIIEANYSKHCNEWSDIYEHLPTLNKYASECDTVIELGMRSVISTWAFAHGLANNSSNKKQLISIDLDYSSNIEQVKSVCKKVGIQFMFIMADDLIVNPPTSDLVFIDTFHVYAQLKRELELYSSKTKKYIIMHDTEVDKIYGESIRNGWNAVNIASETGFSVEDINKGLQPAIDEFLILHPEWKIKEVYTNNNGLTVLERI